MSMWMTRRPLSSCQIGQKCTETACSLSRTSASLSLPFFRALQMSKKEICRGVRVRVDLKHQKIEVDIENKLRNIDRQRLPAILIILALVLHVLYLQPHHRSGRTFKTHYLAIFCCLKSSCSASQALGISLWANLKRSSPTWRL